MIIKRLILIFSLVLAVICIILTLGNRNVQILETKVLNQIELKKEMNIKIEEIDRNQIYKYISRGEAIKVVTKMLNTSNGNIEIHVQLVYITDYGITINALSTEAKKANAQFEQEGEIRDIPVWIVSVEGIKQELTCGKSLHELNIVVDAKSGIALYTFSYR